MARYIVLEVNDNQVAENFIKACNKKTKIGWPFRIVGVFVKPGRTCSCPNARRANYREDSSKHGWAGGIQKGEKFGWWVCTQCGKPRKGGHQLNNQLSMNEMFSELNPSDPDWEFNVTGIEITSIHKAHVKRPKKLRKRKRDV